MMRPEQIIFEAYKELDQIGGDTLTMCSPRRLSLDPIQRIRRATLGEYYDQLKFFAMGGFSGLEVLSALTSDNRFLAKAAELGWSRGSIESCYAFIRHQVDHGAIYSVNEHLGRLLEDTGVKTNIPVRFLAAPKATCYIEFEPPGNRRSSKFKTYDDGRFSICEGCYIQERKFSTLPKMSRENREELELDPNKPARALFIGFTASPINSKKTMAVYQDTMDYATIYIQDEDEPLGDMLERNLNFIMNKRRAFFSVAQNLHSDDFIELYRENFARLFKVLFYLNIERRNQVQVNETKDLEKRINSISEKKRGKLIKQLNRTYDRIVVGPQSYTPRHERVASGSLPPGTKAPHYRSGYFGIRYTGSGQAKVPKLVRIPEVIVNKEFLTDDIGVKDYEIR